MAEVTFSSVTALPAHYRLAGLNRQLEDVRDRVFEFLDELAAIEVLRLHVPQHHQWLVDRLERSLRILDSLAEDIGDVEHEITMIEEGPPEPA